MRTWITRVPKDPIARFWTKVRVGGSDGCWPWMGHIDRNGYGSFWLPSALAKAFQLSTQGSAHRAAWRFTNGPFDPVLDVCHRCDNPVCCNPGHLFLGTHIDNMSDMKSKGRATKPRGSLHHKATITEDDVRTIRALYTVGTRQTDIAVRFGVSATVVSGVVLRKTWKTVA